MLINFFFFFFFLLGQLTYISVSLSGKKECLRLNFPETDFETRIHVKVMY